MADNFSDFPINLPQPEDDGGAAHLVDLYLPSVKLKEVDGALIDISKLQRWWVNLHLP